MYARPPPKIRIVCRGANNETDVSFPTPFAKPPGKGLSSPAINVLWALFNIILGTILFRAGKLSTGDPTALIIFFAGAAAISGALAACSRLKH